MELKVLFIYGNDFQRQMNIFQNIPKSVQICGAMVLSFIFTAAAILCFIRRKFKLRRDGYLSTLIDCWIPFIGGGNLRMEHRLERWFFAILFFGAFFIMSVFSGDLFDCVVQVLNAKVSTFEELAEINPPMYTYPELHLHNDLIYEKLK